MGATPFSSVMNSQRLMAAYPTAKITNLTIAGLEWVRGAS